MAVTNKTDAAAQANKTSDVESRAVLAVAPELTASMQTLATTQHNVASLPKASEMVRAQTAALFSDVDNVERALHLALANLRAVKNRKDTTYYGLELCQRTLDKLADVRAESRTDKRAMLLDEAIALYARCAPFVTTAGSTMRDGATGAEYKADANSVHRMALKMVKRTMSASIRLAPVYLSESNRAGVNAWQADQAAKAAKAALDKVTGGKPVVEAGKADTTTSDK